MHESQRTTSSRRTGARRVAAVGRAVAVLDALAESGGEAGTNELSRRIGVNASTVSRLLATLADAGLVEQVETTGRYRLGVRLVQLGASALARLDVRELARPRLERLVDLTGETATLSLPGDGDAITVDFVRSPASVQSVAQIGRPSIAHATAAGKVLLAFGGGPLPAGSLRAFTSRTTTDAAELAREVERVRSRGWAQAVGEREEGLNALAVPVFGSVGELVVVLGLQVPAARFGPGAMRAAREPLLAAGRQLSAALGWLPG